MGLNDILGQMELINTYRTIPFKNSTITILLKGIWNILQDRSHARPQEKSQ